MEPIVYCSTDCTVKPTCG